MPQACLGLQVVLGEPLVFRVLQVPLGHKAIQAVLQVPLVFKVLQVPQV